MMKRQQEFDELVKFLRGRAVTLNTAIQLLPSQDRLKSAMNRYIENAETSAKVGDVKRAIKYLGKIETAIFTLSNLVEWYEGAT